MGGSYTCKRVVTFVKESLSNISDIEQLSDIEQVDLLATNNIYFSSK